MSDEFSSAAVREEARRLSGAPSDFDEILRLAAGKSRVLIGAAEYARRDGRIASDEYFFAEQNARLIQNAERYAAAARLAEPRLERAIGVIYRPESERVSHYFSATLPRQFDVVLHFDETRAVEPLEVNVEWSGGEVPETFPSAL